MASSPATLIKASSGTLRVRVTDAITGAQVTSATSCTAALVDASGTTVFTGRALTYDALGLLDAADTGAGVWSCAVTAGEVASEGVYTATITIVASGKTRAHSFRVLVTDELG